jgi:hypothetical protein
MTRRTTSGAPSSTRNAVESVEMTVQFECADTGNASVTHAINAFMASKEGATTQRQHTEKQVVEANCRSHLNTPNSL